MLSLECMFMHKEIIHVTIFNPQSRSVQDFLFVVFNVFGKIKSHKVKINISNNNNFFFLDTDVSLSFSCKNNFLFPCLDIN